LPVPTLTVAGADLVVAETGGTDRCIPLARHVLVARA
jgi:hypothetical protein